MTIVMSVAPPEFVSVMLAPGMRAKRSATAKRYRWRTNAMNETTCPRIGTATMPARNPVSMA